MKVDSGRVGLYSRCNRTSGGSNLHFGFFSDWFILLGGFKPTFNSFFEAGLMCKFGIINTGGFLLGWICTE
jgi:hypothetical protein